MFGGPAPHRASPPRGDGSGIGRFEVAAFALLLAAEFLLFDQVGAKHETWIYPRWNDQIQYLTESYLGYEVLRLHGFVRGLWFTLTNPAAQGALHDFFAVLVFSVAGPSRSAALAVNQLAFLAWQGALFFAVRRVFGSRALAWTGAGLLLALADPWRVQQGSAYDFRLDWMAACALGVTLSAALCTRGFQRRGWSVLFGAAVGVTVLIRFLTGTYLALIFAALLVWILNGPDRRRRMVHLLLAAAVAALVAGPILWHNRDTIWTYYWVGHFFGPESSIRNSHLGAVSAFLWLLGIMARLQLGVVWMIWVGVVTALLVVRRARSRRLDSAAGGLPGHAGFLGSLFIAAPAVVLILQPEKTFVVFSALLPGAVVLVLAAWHRLLRAAPRSLPATIAAATLATGAVSFAVRMCRDPNPPGFEANARRVLTVDDIVFARARAAGLTAPRIASDQVTDFLDAQVMRVICYERHRVWMPFQMMLPLGIARAPKALVMERLQESDFVFLCISGPVIDYPWDLELRAMLPATRAWCDAHMEKVGTYEFFGKKVVLYQRRFAPPRQ